jgi:hypothetical protein
MNAIAELKRLGWSVAERPARPLRLPPEVAARYPRIPAALLDFLGRIDSCVDPGQTAWFLCEADFDATGESAYRWNEWEQMSLEAAEGDGQLLSGVRAFWDRHFPFLLTVADGYGYCAVDTSPEGNGRIVMGREPEFEEAEAVAESFGEFMTRLIERGGDPRF